MANNGYIVFCTKKGKTSEPFQLAIGEQRFGSAASNEIRLKKPHPLLLGEHAVLSVNENGIAILTNKSEGSTVTINNKPVIKPTILKHKDQFDILGTVFQYFNEKTLHHDFKDELRHLPTRKRSIHPLLKISYKTSPKKSPNTKPVHMTPSKSNISPRCKTESKVSKNIRLFPSGRRGISLGKHTNKSNSTSKVSSRNILLSQSLNISNDEDLRPSTSNIKSGRRSLNVSKNNLNSPRSVSTGKINVLKNPTPKDKRNSRNSLLRRTLNKAHERSRYSFASEAPTEGSPLNIPSSLESTPKNVSPNSFIGDQTTTNEEISKKLSRSLRNSRSNIEGSLVVNVDEESVFNDISSSIISNNETYKEVKDHSPNMSNISGRKSFRQSTNSPSVKTTPLNKSLSNELDASVRKSRYSVNESPKPDRSSLRRESRQSLNKSYLSEADSSLTRDKSINTSRRSSKIMQNIKAVTDEHSDYNLDADDFQSPVNRATSTRNSRIKIIEDDKAVTDEESVSGDIETTPNNVSPHSRSSLRRKSHQESPANVSRRSSMKIVDDKAVTEGESVSEDLEATLNNVSSHNRSSLRRKTHQESPVDVSRRSSMKIVDDKAVTDEESVSEDLEATLNNVSSHNRSSLRRKTHQESPADVSRRSSMKIVDAKAVTDEESVSEDLKATPNNVSSHNRSSLRRKTHQESPVDVSRRSSMKIVDDKAVTDEESVSEDLEATPNNVSSHNRSSLRRKSHQESPVNGSRRGSIKIIEDDKTVTDKESESEGIEATPNNVSSHNRSSLRRKSLQVSSVNGSRRSSIKIIKGDKAVTDESETEDAETNNVSSHNRSSLRRSQVSSVNISRRSSMKIIEDNKAVTDQESIIEDIETIPNNVSSHNRSSLRRSQQSLNVSNVSEVDTSFLKDDVLKADNSIRRSIRKSTKTNDNDSLVLTDEKPNYILGDNEELESTAKNASGVRNSRSSLSRKSAQVLNISDSNIRDLSSTEDNSPSGSRRKSSKTTENDTDEDSGYNFVLSDDTETTADKSALTRNSRSSLGSRKSQTNLNASNVSEVDPLLIENDAFSANNSVRRSIRKSSIINDDIRVNGENSESVLEASYTSEGNNSSAVRNGRSSVSRKSQLISNISKADLSLKQDNSSSGSRRNSTKVIENNQFLTVEQSGIETIDTTNIHENVIRNSRGFLRRTSEQILNVSSGPEADTSFTKDSDSKTGSLNRVSTRTSFKLTESDAETINNVSSVRNSRSSFRNQSRQSLDESTVSKVDSSFTKDVSTGRLRRSSKIAENIKTPSVNEKDSVIIINDSTRNIIDIADEDTVDLNYSNAKNSAKDEPLMRHSIFDETTQDVLSPVKRISGMPTIGSASTTKNSPFSHLSNISGNISARSRISSGCNNSSLNSQDLNQSTTSVISVSSQSFSSFKRTRSTSAKDGTVNELVGTPELKSRNSRQSTTSVITVSSQSLKRSASVKDGTVSEDVGTPELKSRSSRLSSTGQNTTPMKNNSLSSSSQLDSFCTSTPFIKQNISKIQPSKDAHSAIVSHKKSTDLKTNIDAVPQRKSLRRTRSLSHNCISCGHIDGSHASRTLSRSVSTIEIDTTKKEVTPLLHRKSHTTPLSVTPKKIFDDGVTPKSAIKPNRLSTKVTTPLYKPLTEDITPVTPEKFAATVDESFKTPVNTPGLFDSIKESVIKSRKRKRESNGSFIKERKIAKTDPSLSEETEIIKHPKVQRKKQNSPKNDLTNLPNLRSLVSPKTQKTPKNDLTDVAGVKKLFERNTPKNDLTKVSAVKKIFQKNSPLNDLRNIPSLKELVTVEANSPKNDLSDVRGLKNMFRKSIANDLRNVPNLKRFMSPKAQKSPKNDLHNVSAVASLFNVSGVEQLHPDSDIENSEDLFSSLTGQKPIKQYGRGKSMTPVKNEANNLTKRRTMGDIPISSPRVQEWVNEQSALTENSAKNTLVIQGETGSPYRSRSGRIITPKKPFSEIVNQKESSRVTPVQTTNLESSSTKKNHAVKTEIQLKVPKKVAFKDDDQSLEAAKENSTPVDTISHAKRQKLAAVEDNSPVRKSGRTRMKKLDAEPTEQISEAISQENSEESAKSKENETTSPVPIKRSRRAKNNTEDNVETNTSKAEIIDKKNKKAEENTGDLEVNSGKTTKRKEKVEDKEDVNTDDNIETHVEKTGKTTRRKKKVEEVKEDSEVPTNPVVQEVKKSSRKKATNTPEISENLPSLHETKQSTRAGRRKVVEDASEPESLATPEITENVKPKRGRGKAVKDIAAAEDASTSEVIEGSKSRRRAVRNASATTENTATPEVTDVKPQRGRVVRFALATEKIATPEVVESVKSRRRKAVEEEPTENAAIPEVTEEVKPKRGRAVKNAAKGEDVGTPQVVETAKSRRRKAVEEEPTENAATPEVTEEVKPKRGRAVKNAAKGENVGTPEVVETGKSRRRKAVEEEPTENVATPEVTEEVKPKRGRAVKNAAKGEDVGTPEVVEAAKSRRRKAVEEEPTENVATPEVKEDVKPKRGRAVKNAAKTEDVEDPTENVATSATNEAVKPRRGRTVKDAPIPNSVDTPEVTKPKRGRAIADKEETESPSVSEKVQATKRGRKQASVDEDKTEVATKEVQKKTGRKKAAQTVEVVDENTENTPEKRLGRSRKAKDAENTLTPQKAAKRPKKQVKADENKDTVDQKDSETHISPKKTRGKRVATKNTKQELENVSENSENASEKRVGKSKNSSTTEPATKRKLKNQKEILGNTDDDHYYSDDEVVFKRPRKNAKKEQQNTATVEASDTGKRSLRKRK
ncbi:uncharacterized protein PF11_0213-like [Sitophilus oryzae]|uniref:Uncharacterized protein PF11_0213-like n=1 Tax=Sitophilus oryzae TaxID=7048 RepID=A0A6J2Y4J7_SITOR|nr:uncharacterized protein PF11_0213-like [Sitophilus oryzae]XP_030757925.1 uncharacterized protein PF11_0213-like [Sitophilus oryzae]